MKKIFLTVMMFLMIQGVASAEPVADYSLMDAPLPEHIEIGEIKRIPNINVDLASGASVSWEEKFYNKLDSIFAPENLEKQTIMDLGKGYYGIAAPSVTFSRDTSFETVEQELAYRIEQIHEVYARYLADNPEYFYLIPRSYAFDDYTDNHNMTVYFMPLIAVDFPEFDGTSSAVSELVRKYNVLMAEIQKARDEIYFEGMTDLDKLLLAHDYIVNNNAYYLTYNEDGTEYFGDGYSFNAYGILVNKQGVCQGLSYAYPCILKALGYPVENIRQIRSTKMKHMWNFVKLDDKWYHVDLTWDDPTYRPSADEKYDMTDASLQHEHHDYFLISDATNTKLRNEKGYEGFTLEILGYDDSDHSLADDASYESGWFFNDPTSNGTNTFPGRVEYENGSYKKYYDNKATYFLNDTLKASDYMISQVEYNQYGVPGVYVWGANKREVPNEVLTQYVGYYDNSGRFLTTKVGTQNLTYFGWISLYDYYEAPESGQSAKIITVRNGFTPVANTPIMK